MFNLIRHFTTLRQGQTKFGLAPHKPVLLLAVVEGCFINAVRSKDADRLGLVLREPDSVVDLSALKIEVSWQANYSSPGAGVLSFGIEIGTAAGEVCVGSSTLSGPRTLTG